MTRPTVDALLDLMSTLAHDLRSPLTPVKGYAEILRNRPDLGAAKTEEYAGVIVTAAARLERSVDMLSGVAALYGGRGQVRKETVDITDVIAERLDIWRGRSPERTFAGHTGPTPARVLIDRAWLGRALDVLLEHAAKTWPHPAEISLRALAGPRGDTVKIVVSTPSAAEPPESTSADALGRAFVTAVCEATQCRLTGDFEIEVPVAAAL